MSRKTTRKSIPSSIKDKLWRKCCGDKLDGECCVCQIPIQYNNCHVAHIKPVAKGGSNTIDNLTITCASCNLSMGTMDLEEFKAIYIGGESSTTNQLSRADQLSIYNEKIKKQNDYLIDFYKTVFPLFKSIKNRIDL
jgi:hypothetical protein